MERTKWNDNYKSSGSLWFFAQGDNFEIVRENLHDVIEGNVVLALQLDSHLVDLSLEENISGW